MIKKIKCDNLNHEVLDIKVKYCSDCGEQFSALKGTSCDDIKHARRRKERAAFCCDCGAALG